MAMVVVHGLRPLLVLMAQLQKLHQHSLALVSQQPHMAPPFPLHMPPWFTEEELRVLSRWDPQGSQGEKY